MRHALLSVLLAVCAASACAPAHAWWNKDWTQRTQLTLDTTAKGAETKEAASNVAVPVRLHSGNFDFVNAKEDGADLRFVAGDDKTPLKYSVERWDGINELALVWVQVPTVMPGSDKNVVYAYAGNPKAAAEPGGGVFDAPFLAAVHFSAGDALKPATPPTLEPNGLLAGSAKMAGTPVTWPASPTLQSAAGAPLTLSLWARPTDATRGTLLQWGAVRIGLEGGTLSAQFGNLKLAGGEPAAGAWSHVALTLAGGKAVLYLNGAAVAQADGDAPALGGELRAGDGYTGLIDELELAATARSAEWLRLAAAAQGPDGKLVTSRKEGSGESAETAHGGYIGVLVGNLTTDAWVVIVILGVMFAIACWVMVSKTLFVSRADQDNRRFLQRFRVATSDLLYLDRGAAHPHSSLYRLYQAGLRELRKRDIGVDEQTVTKPLSGASIDAVKASIDADLVRESHRLNAQMVLLTIAISGGPFLGLLGTVVGVMITFAAIAAAGDVNVNAIAPGIAAALLATVAGLGVAIPALFGYNYLASRIKNISADMQIFVDEFVTRVAETYGAR